MFFLSFAESVSSGLLVSIFIYESLRIMLEFVCLYLASMFSTPVEIKSFVNSEGELVICGSGAQREHFNFTIRAENKCKSMKTTQITQMPMATPTC